MQPENPSPSPEQNQPVSEEQEAIAFREAEIERFGIDRQKPDGTPKDKDELWKEIIDRQLEEKLHDPNIVRSAEDRERIKQLRGAVNPPKDKAS